MPRSNAEEHPGANLAALPDLERVRVVLTALERMAAMLRHGRSGGPGAALGELAGALTLKEAVEHAAAMAAPKAFEDGAIIELDISEAAARFPAGPTYAIALNGLRNALEAMDAEAGAKGRRVVVRADVEGCGEAEEIVLRVLDEGAGLRGLPVVQVGQDEAVVRAARFGFSTKSPGRGVGLALCSELIGERGGTLELRTRAGMKGCELVARYPTHQDAGRPKGSAVGRMERDGAERA